MKAFTHFVTEHIQPILMSTLAVFAPVKAILIVTGVLIIADLISGIMAAKKRGESISSAGLRRTITKIFVYNMAVVTGFLVEKYMITDIFPVSKLIAGIISVVELKSILENLNTINGTDIFKSIIEKLGSSNDAPKK